MINIGIIGSSGGSALAAASDCIKMAGYEVEYSVLTERDCGLSRWGEENAKNFEQIEFTSNVSFSLSANEFFDACGCDNVVLYFIRLVTADLFEAIPTWNIHPALLPSFPGLHGVDDAFNSGVKIFGASLHRVDASVDAGKILAQVASPLPASYTLEEINRISFIQKVWLTLLWFDLIYISNKLDFNTFEYNAIKMISNPSIGDKNILNAFMKWVTELEDV